MGSRKWGRHASAPTYSRIQAQSPPEETLLGDVEHCGALCSIVEHCGALWSIVESCGALWSIVEHCGALWSIV